LVVDRIVLVDGRLDSRNGEPKVLVDTVTVDLDEAANFESPPQTVPQNQPDPGGALLAKSGAQADERPSGDPLPSVVSQQIAEGSPRPPLEGSGGLDEAAEGPPPPDLFPSGWGIDGVTPTPIETDSSGEQPTGVRVAEEGDPRHGSEKNEGDSPEQTERDDHIEQSVDSPLAADFPQVPSSTLPPPDTGPQRPSEPLEVPESASPIMPPFAPSDGSAVQMVTVVMRPSGDKVRDNLRVRQIYGHLISYPGNDRFAFHIFEGGRGHLLEFPNFTTGVCQELITHLCTLVGSENVRVEPITFQ
jgi:hypothetical protein